MVQAMHVNMRSIPGLLQVNLYKYRLISDTSVKAQAFYRLSISHRPVISFQEVLQACELLYF